ncbi:TRADD-N-associated membrane domain-containing protein [Nonomuraea sp. NPDC002799]
MTRVLAGDDDSERPTDQANVEIKSIGGAVYQAGGDIYFSDGWTGAPAPDVAAQRQSFFFDFLRQALKQAETTFRLSVIFMSAGAVILLTGGVLALVNAGNPDWSYLPLLTSLSGLLITTCGGAFALHANRARKHLTVQAERIHENMQADTTLAQALELIDRVDDPILRDRLKSFTAMRVLNLQPEPNRVAEQLFSPQRQDPPPEIQQGRAKRKPGSKGEHSARDAT